MGSLTRSFAGACAVSMVLGLGLGQTAWSISLQDPTFAWPLWNHSVFLTLGALTGALSFLAGTCFWRMALDLAWPLATRVALAGLLPWALGWADGKVLAVSLPYPHDLAQRKLGLLLAAQILLGVGLSVFWAIRAFSQIIESSRFSPKSLALRLGGVTLIVYMLCGQWVGQWNVTGDAPHYLLQAHSLIYDHDTDLKNNYTHLQYAAFYDGFLETQVPDQADGRHIIEHKVGLSLLLAPAYHCLRLSGARLTLTVLAAAATGLFFLLCLQLSYSRQEALLGWALLAWTAPWWTHSTLIMPELVGGVLLLLAFCSWQAVLPVWVASLSLAFLPWISVRYYFLALSAGVVEWALFRKRGPVVARSIAWVLLSLVAALAFNRYQFGSIDPAKSYKQRQEAHFDMQGLPSTAPPATDSVEKSHWNAILQPQLIVKNTAGLLIDQEYGWLPYNPVFGLAFLGLWSWSLQRRRLFWTTVLPSLAYLFPVASFPWWWSAYAPNRFLVCLTPFFCLWTLECWRAWGSRPAFKALAGLSVAWALLLTMLPWFTWSKQQGANWPLRLMGQALHLDIAVYFPSFMVARPWSWAWFLALMVGWWLAAYRLGKPRP